MARFKSGSDLVGTTGRVTAPTKVFSVLHCADSNDDKTFSIRAQTEFVVLMDNRQSLKIEVIESGRVGFIRKENVVLSLKNT